MKVIIAGGGTGGHLYPGIAIARELLKESGNQVLFVGTEQGIESRILPKEGLPLRFIKAGKIKGMGLSSIIKTLFGLPASLFQAKSLLNEEKPDIVVGVGGYASAAVSVAAWLKGIPLIIIEPNAYPGLANRLLGRIATKVVLSFPGSNIMGFFKEEKVFCVGPLVREGIVRGDREKAIREFGLDPRRFTVLVFGGSAGAHAINMTMKAGAGLLSRIPALQLLHQTGEKDAEEVRLAYAAAGLKAVVLPYIYDMASAYAAADMIVSRSGATTVAELAVVGKPAVLIPYPFAADNHQEYNARALASHGMAALIIQKDLTPERLASTIDEYSRKREQSPNPMDTVGASDVVELLKRHVQKD